MVAAITSVGVPDTELEVIAGAGSADAAVATSLVIGAGWTKAANQLAQIQLESMVM